MRTAVLSLAFFLACSYCLFVQTEGNPHILFTICFTLTNLYCSRSPTGGISCPTSGGTFRATKTQKINQRIIQQQQQWWKYGRFKFNSNIRFESGDKYCVFDLQSGGIWFWYCCQLRFGSDQCCTAVCIEFALKVFVGCFVCCCWWIY